MNYIPIAMVSGNYITASLFKECKYETTYAPSFTIKRNDTDGLPSLFRIYMEYCLEDPTEISFVNEVFDGDLDHWEAVKSCKYFAPYYAKWQKELELRILSVSLKEIREIALSDDKNKLAAHKTLLQYGVSPNAKKPEKRGRKPKQKPEDNTSDSLLAEAMKAIQDA